MAAIADPSDPFARESRPKQCTLPGVSTAATETQSLTGGELVRNTILAVCVCAATIVSSSRASAEDDSPETERHQDFFMRLTVGPSFSRFSIGEDDIDLNVQGAGGYGSLLIGGTIARNTALHATLLGQAIIDPDLDEAAIDPGISLGTLSEELDDTTARTSGFGLGVSHYLDNNFFFGGSVLLSWLSVEFFGDGITVERSSDAGIGVNLNVGKEWYVGQKAAIGVIFEGLWAMAPQDNTDSNWTSFGGSLNFSFTYH